MLDGARVSSLKFSTGAHGCESMQATFPMSQAEAMPIYNAAGMPHAVISANGDIIWSGRVEDIEIVPEGLAVTAFGYWNALSDKPYTQLWSDVDLNRWQITAKQQIPARQPDLYVNNQLANQLYTSLTKNATYGNMTQSNEWHYLRPHLSTRGIVTLSFDYQMFLPFNWRLQILRYTTRFSVFASVMEVTSFGTLLTDTIDAVFPGHPSDMVGIVIYNATGASYTNTAESGTFFFRATNVRVKTTIEPSITSYTIAQDLLYHAGDQLVADTSMLGETGTDYFNALYEDVLPSDILTNIANLGDPGRLATQWEVGVNAQRKLYLRPYGSASREWFVDVEDAKITRSLSTLYNSAYATYLSPSGNQKLRTPTWTNDKSVGQYGVERRAALEYNSSSFINAIQLRDVFVNDKKDIKPRASFRVTNLDQKWLVKAGDYLNIRNVMIDGGRLSNVRRCRIARTEYDVMTDTLTIETEAPLSALDFYIARAEAPMLI